MDGRKVFYTTIYKMYDWIVDFKGLGGTAFIGKPKQPTFTVCQLVGDEYQQTQFRLGDLIISPTFPEFQLRLNDILPC
jgi:Uma2 family endonuclease